MNWYLYILHHDHHDHYATGPCNSSQHLAPCAVTKIFVLVLCSFLIALFVSLLLGQASSLYILDIDPLSYVLFVNIFSLWRLPFNSLSPFLFSFHTVPLVYFCFCRLCFWFLVRPIYFCGL